MSRERIPELKQLVESIPKGRVTSYGQIGRALSNPVSGFLAGKWMDQCPDVPWCRVMRAKGDLSIGKMDLVLEAEQRMRLESEGVVFDESSRVPQNFFYEIEAID